MLYRAPLLFRSPAEIAALKPGEVILAGISAATPNGLIRFVTKIEMHGSGVTLTTVNAPIQAAFQKLHVVTAQRTFDIGDEDATVTPLNTFGPRKQMQAVRSATGSGEREIPLDFVVYDGDDNATTTDDQVTVKGALKGKFDYVAGFDTDWGIVEELPEDVAKCVLSAFSNCSIGSLLPEASAGFEVHARTDANITLAGSPFLKYTKDIPVASVKLSAFAIGPLVFVPEVRLQGKLEGKASSKFVVTAGAHAGVDGGVSFSTSKGAYGQAPTPFFNADTPTATVALSASGRVGIEARLRLALYELLGPYASLTAYAQVNANQNVNPCWSVDAGLDGAIGFDIGIDLGSYGYQSLADAKAPFNLLNETLASGTCDFPAGFSTLGIGEGPDPEHLANPTFVPYAIANSVTTYDDDYQEPFTGNSVYAELGTMRTYSARTIDGAFVVGATESAGVVKIKEDGTSVWGAEYTFADFGLESKYARLAGIASNGDATILIAAEPYHIIRIDQGGTPVSGLTFDVPKSAGDSPHGDSTDGQRFWDAIADNDGGVYLSATQTDPGSGKPTARVWIMRLDVSGNVLWSRRFGEGSVQSYFPTVLLLAPDGGVIVAGNNHLGTEQPFGTPHPGFLINLNASGDVVFARKYQQTCSVSGSDTDLVPLGGTLAKSGDVILVGNADNYDSGFVMRINTSGSATGIRGTTRASENAFFLTALDELPTGGFVASGYTTFGGATGRSGILMQILDSGLNATTTVVTQFNDFSIAMTRIVATDDGGALVHAAKTNDYAVGVGDGIFALKVPAKNLAINYVPGSTTATTPSISDSGCTVTTANWNVPVSDYAPAAHSSEVTAAPFGLATLKLNQ